MKKLILVLLIISITVSGLSLYSFFEPRVLEEGKIKVSIGLMPTLSYGLLDILEVGISPYSYVKLGNNFGNIHYSFSYVRFLNLMYLKDSWLFVGLGYYHENFNIYGNVFYTHEELWDWIYYEDTFSSDYEFIYELIEENKHISLFANLTIYNHDFNGDFTLRGGYDYLLESNNNNNNNNAHTGMLSLKIGSNFIFDWWFFNNLYLYGELGIDFPYIDLATSIIVLAGIETEFQLISK